MILQFRLVKVLQEWHVAGEVDGKVVDLRTNRKRRL